jgi:hypothetical protein
MAHDDLDVQLHWPDGHPDARVGAPARQTAASGTDTLPVVEAPRPLGVLADASNVVMKGMYDAINLMSSRLDALTARAPQASTGVAPAAIAELVSEVRNLAAEIETVKEDLAKVRRRLPLRTNAVPAFDNQQIERLAVAVVDRLAETFDFDER